MGNIRLSGLISGLDTDSIIKELVNAQRLKNKKVSDKLTTSEWKEEKWKELNTKIYKLYTDSVSKMRLQSTYKTKSVATTNDNLISVTADSSVPEGLHKVSVSKLASAQYVTGDKIKVTGKTITDKSKLVSDLGMTDGTLITIETKDGKKTLEVNSNTTINDFIQNCKGVGLNASYDKTQNRFFISSKTSGADNAFTISTTSDPGTTFKRKVDNAVGYSNLSSTDKAKVDAAYKVLKDNNSLDSATWDDSTINAGDNDATKAVKNAINTIKGFVENKYKADTTIIATAQVKDEIVKIINEGGTYDGQSFAGIKENDEELAKKELEKKYNNESLDFDDPDLKSELESLVNKKVSARADELLKTETAKNDIVTAQEKISTDGIAGDAPVLSLTNTLAEVGVNVVEYTKTSASTVIGELSKMGLGEITKGIDSNGNAIYTSSNPNVSLVEASDSKINYNGAEITGNTNTLVVNGLTLNLKGVTATGESISLTVANNTQANYDMVKDFIKSYNDILKEMNTLYYATSSKGYEPLSDDEKEQMTDDQIEKWETKIKDSVLRRDSTLGSLISAMKDAMATSVTAANGKSYTLSSFGIMTSSDYSEKGLLHIYGDSADSTYSMMEDKLKKALTDDPDTVISALSGVAKNLYDSMYDKMKSIPNVRSALTFYNDKVLDKEQNDYKKRVATLESKLTEMENKYYKQFSAMESAMAKMQSQSNALAGLLGTSR